MTKIENLQNRVEKLDAGGDTWIPPWLLAVGSREEIAEWRSINQAYHGHDRRDRMDQFIRDMRKKHPNMLLTLDEEMWNEARKLTEDKDLATHEGLTEEDMQD